MTPQVLITIGNGSFESGFSVSHLDIYQDGRHIARKNNHFQLPSNPDFPRLYDQWRDSYIKLGQEIQARAIDIPEEQITNVSSLNDCETAAQPLKSNVNHWFRQDEFQDIRAYIIRKLFKNTPNPNQSLRVIIDTSNPYLRKLSWDFWDLFGKDFLPEPEFALLSEYNPPKETWSQPISILAIFGSDRGGLELDKDKELIDNLNRYGATITSIPEKGDFLTPRKLFDTIRQGNWDIIFYAGHSSGETLEIDPTVNVSIDQLRTALQEAAPTVKLAIFNSCDGLGIAEYLADFNIPNMIVMREPVSDLVARDFLKYFLNEFTQGISLHSSVRKARKRLESLEFQGSDGLFYPRASKIPVLILNPATPELYWPASEEKGELPSEDKEDDPKKYQKPWWIRLKLRLLKYLTKLRHLKYLTKLRHLKDLILFLLTIIFAVGIFHLKPKTDNISIGEEILLGLKSKAKEQGVKKVKECEKQFPTEKSSDRKECYLEAAKSFQESWNQDKRGDAETLIYLNNAILEATGANYYTIAVAVSIKRNQIPWIDNKDRGRPDEILRGVAQKQTEVNWSLLKKFPNFEKLKQEDREKLELEKYIQKREQDFEETGLKVIIANDGNKEEQAEKVAKAIVNRSDILGVVGHWTSEMTMATVDIYENKELVMVSPGTSTSELTDDRRNIFFRTSSTNEEEAKKMANVLNNNEINQNRAAIFYNPDSPYSGDYKEKFENEFRKQPKEGDKRGSIIGKFDISQSNFDLESAMEKIKDSGELAIALIPDAQVTTHAFQNTLKIIRENRGHNWMVGNSSIYNWPTLEKFQDESQLLEKLILIVSWHPLSSADSDFPGTSKELWGGDVNARTALSYDAAQVLIKGIWKVPTRSGVQKTLASRNFKLEGVTGEIKFQEGLGDRIEQPLVLVRVCQRKDSDQRSFVPLDYSGEEFNCPTN